MTLFFIRHGQSEAQVGLPSAGLGLASLTPLGRTQASHAATRIRRSHMHMPRVVASSFRRPIETGTILLAPWTPQDLGGIQGARDPKPPFLPSVDPDLPVHEFTFLAPENRRGTTAEERVAPVDAWWNRNDPDHVDGPGAESLTDLFRRVERALLTLHERERNRPDDPNDHDALYVVSHARFMQAVLWHVIHEGNLATMRDVRRFRAFCLGVRIPNVGFLKLKVGPARTWTVGSIDDSHIPSGQRTE